MSNVGYATLSVIPSMKGFGSKLSAGVDPQMSKAGAAGGKKFGGGMVASAKSFVAPLAALFAVSAGVAFFKGAVDGASDLSESASKVGVVFGAQAAQIMKASETSATAMGLSKAAYLEATGGLGNLLVSLKVAPKAAADMSQEMVKLAGDMASFNNVPVEDALLAIRSGLTGETEPLKRFGVNMNDATLKAQAMKMGLIATTKDAMSPQTKALAAQALIMGQTGTAQGDFARTSGGLANQQKILAAHTDDLKTKIGGALLPAVTNATTAVSGFVGGMQNGTGAGGRFRDVLVDMKNKGTAVVGWLKDNTTAVKVAAVGIGVLTVAVQAHNLALAISTGSLKAWIAQTTIVKTATAVWAAGQWLLNIALTANPIGIVVMTIALLVGAVVLIATKTTWFQTVWAKVWGVIGTPVKAVWGWIKSNWPLLLAILTGPIGLAVLAIVKNWDTIRNAFATGVAWVLTKISEFIGGIANMLRVLSNIPGFGWAKTAADNMDGAANKARKLADNLRGIKAPPPISIRYGFTLSGKLPAFTGSAKYFNVPGNAMGTDNWRGGPTWVGERGPEIVNLPRGSQVIPNHKTGAGAGLTQNIYPTPGMSEEQVGAAAARQLEWAMRGTR